MSYYNCFACVATTINLTDYTEPQSIIDGRYFPLYVKRRLGCSWHIFIELYDDCASLGFQIPVLTFPGQNPNRVLSSVVIPSQTTVSILSLPSTVQTTVSAPLPTSSSGQTTVGTLPVTPANTSPVATNPPSTTSSSSGIGSVETSYFNLVANAMMLGTWFYFTVLWEFLWNGWLSNISTMLYAE